MEKPSAGSALVDLLRSALPALWVFLVLHAVIRLTGLDVPLWQRLLVGLPFVLLVEWALRRLAALTGLSFAARAARRTVRIVLLGGTRP
jgi:hypothetical protein